MVLKVQFELYPAALLICAINNLLTLALVADADLVECKE